MGSSQFAGSTVEEDTLWPWVSQRDVSWGRSSWQSPCPADVHLAAEMKADTLCWRLNCGLFHSRGASCCSQSCSANSRIHGRWRNLLSLCQAEERLPMDTQP